MPSGENSGTLLKNDLKPPLDMDMTRNNLAAIIFTGLIVSLLSGCSGNKDYVFDNGPAGPNTEKSLEKLPKGLLPDVVNANHTTKGLKPNQGR